MSRNGGRGRTSRLRMAGIVLAVLACGSAWGEPSFDAAGLRRLLGARGFSAAQTQAALATLDDASTRGLPAAVLEARLREGLARRATPDTILRVLADRTAGLARAEEVARRGAAQGVRVRDRESSFTRLADAFSMGVAPADVSGLLPAAARAGGDLDGVSRAAEVMGRLARRGFPSSDTGDVLQAALAAGWKRGQLDGLVDVFDKAKGLGIPRDRTQQSLVEGIRGGKDLGRLVAAEAPTKGASAPAASGAGTGKGGGTAHGNTPGARSASPRSPGGRGPAVRPPGHQPAPRTPVARPPSPHTPGPRMPPRAPTRGPVPRTPGPRMPPPHH